jgi:3-carboxy-cis,cis-muconate cycloisomerase
MTDLADTLFSTPEMLSVFSGESHVRQMLAFEAGLARAQAEAGIIPPDAAAAIADRCRVELFDVAALFREAVPAGTPAIPLVRRLTELVEGDARKYVHWGATSQDVIDTATALQIRDGLDLLEGGLLGVCAACASLAERHRHTPMAGRTLLQQALPITFGLKAARWLALATRRVLALRERALSVQLGGAAGTLASLGEHGVRVVELLAADLGLSAPDLPWHTEQDRVAEVAAALGIVAGAMGKIAGDVVLLAQTEVGEVAEGAAPGKGGSSTLPQKRNPVDAIEAIAAARLAMGMVPVLLSAMVQEHERAAGAWQAEWAAIPDLFRFTAGAVERVRGALAGLEVDPDRMRTNLELTGGLVMAESLSMALAAQVGKQEAHHIIQAASRRALAAGVDLREAALEDERVRAALSSEDLDRALDPSSYLGSTDTFIDRALDGYRALPPREPGR